MRMTISESSSPQPTKDLERVDGFETSFVGWGLEDSDIVIRMIRSGVKRKDGRFATGVLHLWHEEADRSQLAAHRAKLDVLLKSDRVRALRGLSALEEDCRAVVAGAGSPRFSISPPGGRV